MRKDRLTVGMARVRASALTQALAYGARRAVGFRYVPIEAAATRRYTLCTAAEIPAITPFVWDGHLPRVRAAARYSAEHTITHFLKRKTFVFKPVVAYWLQNAALLDGSIYSRGYRHELRPWGSRPHVGLGLAGPTAEVNQGALVSTSLGSTWWGHWLEDDLPLQILAERFAPPVGHWRQPYRDEPVFQRVLGMANPARYGAARFKELLVVDDSAQNPDKTRRYHVLRERTSRLPKGHDRVFLSRGSSGARRILVNESAVRSRLEAQGFRTVDVSSCNADEMIAACSGCSVVVSVEGSHLAPLLYLMGDFSTMVILNPPYQVQTTVATVALFCGISSGMFICEPHEDSRTDFVADPEELLRFIDAVTEFSSRTRPQTARFIDATLKLASTGSNADVTALVS